jgi:hypothetical protein
MRAIEQVRRIMFLEERKMSARLRTSSFTPKV